MAKVIQVIELDIKRGCGHSDVRPCDERRFDSKHRHEPIRTVTQYWSLEGQLLAEDDAFAGHEILDVGYNIAMAL